MRTILIIALLFHFTSIFGQYQPLKELNLETGEYTVLATFLESDKSSLRDSLREWYMDDIQLLKDLQSVWTFDEEAPHYACGYHYSIRICKNGREVDEFRVNLNCGTVVHDDKSYKFDSNKLRYLLDKKKGRFIRRRHLMGIEEARRYVDSIQGNKALIYAPMPDWIKYEGTFEFTYHYPKGKEAYFPELEDRIDTEKLQYSEDSVLVRIETEMKKAYPEETFIIESFGGSLTEIFIRITCNKSLEEKFNLYPRTEYDTWEHFKPRFEVYWK
jgi:hypothetical protein